MNLSEAETLVSCLSRTDEVFDECMDILISADESEMRNKMIKVIGEISADIYLKIFLNLKREFPELDILDE